MNGSYGAWCAAAVTALMLGPLPARAQVVQVPTPATVPAAPHAPIFPVPAGEAAESIALGGGDEVAAQARVEAALDGKVGVDFDEAPLRDVLAELEKQAGADIEIDWGALEDCDVNRETKATLRVHDVTLRAALGLLLDPHQSTAVPRDGMLLVTSADKAATLMDVVIYPVADLLEVDADGRLDYDLLIDAIVTVVAPMTWEEIGGPGRVRGIRGGLLILQTADNHRRIEQLLAALRGLPPAARDKLPATHPAARSGGGGGFGGGTGGGQF